MGLLAPTGAKQTWQTDYSVRVRVRSSLGRVMLGLSDILGRFGLGRAWFGSGQFQVN